MSRVKTAAKSVPKKQKCKVQAQFEDLGLKADER